MPLSARLLASLPPLVKTISSLLQPSKDGDLAARGLKGGLRLAEAQCPLDGLPKWSSRNGRMAAATAGSIGVLAL